jgi:hypothetical protein
MRRFNKLSSRIALAAASLTFCVLLLAIAMLVCHYRRNDFIVASIKELDGTFEIESTIPEWFESICEAAGIGDFVYMLGDIVMVSLSGEAVADDDIEFLASSRSLREMLLVNTSVSAEGLSVVSGLKELRGVVLFGPAGGGVQSLQSSNKLTTLVIRSPLFEDSDLGVVAKFRGLRTLALSDTDITDAGVARISEMQSLRDVALRNARITDLAVRHLSSLKSLETLDISGCQVTDAGAEVLSRMESIQRLVVADSRISGSAVASMLHNRTLQRLDIDCHQLMAWESEDRSGCGALKVMSVVYSPEERLNCERLCDVVREKCPSLHVEAVAR